MSKRWAGAMLALVLAGCGVAVRPLPQAVRAAATGRSAPVALDIFYATDNELDPGPSRLVRTAAAAAATASVGMAALYDGSLGNPNLLITAKAQGTPAKTALKEPDSGSKTGLEQFLTQAAQAVPASRRVLSLMDHGGGIMRGLCIDEDDYEHPRVIHVAPLAQALQARPVEVLLFDACFMNMAEVAYAVKDGARAVVGGQTITRGQYPYEQFVPILAADGQASGPELAKRFLKAIDQAAEYKPVAFGAVDTSRMESLADAVAGLVQVLKLHTSTHRAAMREALAASRPYADEEVPSMLLFNDYRDFGTVMQALAALPLPDVQQASQKVLRAAQAAVIGRVVHEDTDFPAAGLLGLSLYAPSTGKVDTRYAASAWNQRTGWGDWLLQVNADGSRRSAGTVDGFPFAFPMRGRTP